MNSNIKDLKISPMALIKVDELAWAPPIPCQHVTISGRDRVGSHGISHSPDPARSGLRLPLDGSPGTRRCLSAPHHKPIVTILVCLLINLFIVMILKNLRFFIEILHDALCRFL